MKQPGYQSKETAFAGLPNAVKLINSVGQAAPPSATFVTMIFDAPARFNYGGYTFRLSGAALDGVIIPGPGVYEAVAQIGFIANSQLCGAYFFVNGAIAAPDGAANLDFTGATFSNGVYIVSRQVRMIAELKAGDIVSIVQDQSTSVGGPQPTAANYTWMYVEKKEGRF